MSLITYTPHHYHNTFGAHPPALSLEAGDTLITSTLDAHGYDSTGTSLIKTSNPLSGPFFVQGAQPGDTLVVAINRLDITRDTGFSYRTLRPNTVTPEMVPHLPPREESTWMIDREKNVTSPQTPPEKLPQFSLPLKPVLGCIGVAPPRGQFISSYTCGNFGGNLDSPAVTCGTVLYLPVFEEGALLFVGDGHATQSHGELPGTGIEVPMQVEMEIDLIKGKCIDNPRGEHDSQRFTLGVHRPLETALQLSVSEMLTWLQEDPGLSLDEACLLLGQAARFEIGNVISPYYCVACLIDQSLLQYRDI